MGCGLTIEELAKGGSVLAAFPIHNAKEKVMLEKRWLRAHDMPWNQPIWDVKSYYGEKIGLYFGFIAHLTGWLVQPTTHHPLTQPYPPDTLAPLLLTLLPRPQLAPVLFGFAVYAQMAFQSSYEVSLQFWCDGL